MDHWTGIDKYLVVNSDDLQELESIASDLDERSSKESPANILQKGLPPVATSQGWLMSDPGTKGLLTMENMIALKESFMLNSLGLNCARDRPNGITLDDIDQFEALPFNLRQGGWRQEAINGDDCIAIGTEEYLSNVAPCHENNFMSVHQTKFGVGDNAEYCKEYFHIDQTTEVTTLGWDNYLQYVMVDYIKPSFISPETTPSQDDVNPALGKGQALMKRLSWSAPGWSRMSHVLRARFFARNRFNIFGGWKSYDRRCDIPTAMGGLGLGPFDFYKFDLTLPFEACSAWHRKAILYVMNHGEGYKLLGRILSGITGDRYLRGIRKDSITDCENLDFLEELPGRSLDELAEMYYESGDLQRNDGMHKKTKLLEKKGFITIHSLRKHLERLNCQKLLLLKKPNKGFRQASWADRYTALDARISDFFFSRAKEEGLPNPKRSDIKITGAELNFEFKTKILMNLIHSYQPAIKDGTNVDMSNLLVDGSLTYELHGQRLQYTPKYGWKLNINNLAAHLTTGDLYICKDDLTVGALQFQNPDWETSEEGDAVHSERLEYLSSNLLQALLDDNLKLDLPSLTPGVPETVSISDSSSTVFGQRMEPNRPGRNPGARDGNTTRAEMPDTPDFG